LRLAAYELLHAPSVPPKVVINEGVELAKRFGGENSGRFINGVLRTILEEHPRADEKPSAKHDG
jgi:N utilization substance protein B